MARKAARYKATMGSDYCKEDGDYDSGANKANKLKIGIYARVSVNNLGSESIENQLMICLGAIKNIEKVKVSERSVLQNYNENSVSLEEEDRRIDRDIDKDIRCMCQKYENIDYVGKQYIKYIDRGYSGYSMERRAYKNMLKDISAGKINCIVVKDLSRIGRNYIEVNSFVEKYILERKIRLIAVNDNYDSGIDGETKLFEIVIKSIFNEMYVRDTGKKIKLAKKAKMEAGSYVGVYPPYGYKISNVEYKRILVVDYKVEPIVKKIYEIYSETGKIKDVEEYLYRNKVRTKRDYYKSGKVYYERKAKRWSYKSIKDVLTNEVYRGNLIQNKSKRIYAGNRILRSSNEKEEYVVIRKSHKGIV